MGKETWRGGGGEGWMKEERHEMEWKGGEWMGGGEGLRRRRKVVERVALILDTWVQGEL